jgi:hypothetical protein
MDQFVPLSTPIHAIKQYHKNICTCPHQYIIYVRMNAQEKVNIEANMHTYTVGRDKVALSRVKHGLSFIKTVCTKNKALPYPGRLLPYTTKLPQACKTLIMILVILFTTTIPKCIILL